MKLYCKKVQVYFSRSFKVLNELFTSQKTSLHCTKMKIKLRNTVNYKKN